MIDSISRWLVGSSISSTSGRPSRTRASATRIFQPPDRAPTSPSIWSSLRPRPCSTARACASSVAAEMLVLLLRVAEARQDPVHIAGASAAGDRFIEDRPALHLLHVLAEVADGQLLGNRDLA